MTTMLADVESFNFRGMRVMKVVDDEVQHHRPAEDRQDGDCEESAGTAAHASNPENPGQI